MNSKVKVIIGFAAFAVFIVAATIAYNALSSSAAPPQELSATNRPGTLAGAPQSDGQEAGADEKTLAPDFTVTDASGNPVKLSDYKGKPIVLNFWASWCPPCKSEMPEFNKVHSELGGDVTFMMVDLVDGYQETQKKGAAYVEKEKFTFPVYFDTEQDAANAYGIMSIPTTIFIDKGGYITATARGAIDEKSLRAGIEMIRGE